MAERDDAWVWEGDRVAGWIRQAEQLDRQIAAASHVLFEAAALQPGEAVLDVGCGTGPTTREAARRVGPSGRVTGLDVSPAMLDAAERVPVTGGAPISWTVADAVTWEPHGPAHDVLLSRFGVMFFSDPPEAARRLTAAVRPGGRLAVVVWSLRERSPLFETTYRVTFDTLAARGRDPRPEAQEEGPFSWAHDETVTALLGGAGWSEVRVVEHVVAMPLGGGLPPREAALTVPDFGPAGRLLAAAEPADVDAVVEALVPVLAENVDEHGHVVLDGAVRVITATRPPAAA